MTFEELAKRITAQDEKLLRDYQMMFPYNTLEGDLRFTSIRALNTLSAVRLICEALGSMEIPKRTDND